MFYLFNHKQWIIIISNYYTILTLSFMALKVQVSSLCFQNLKHMGKPEIKFNRIPTCIYCTAKAIAGCLPNLEDRFLWHFRDKYLLFPFISLKVLSNRRKIVGGTPKRPPIQTTKESKEEILQLQFWNILILVLLWLFNHIYFRELIMAKGWTS